MAELLVEAWLPEIKNNPIPNTSFISASRDLSAFVRNNKVNLAEAGVHPDVVVDKAPGAEVEVQQIDDIPNDFALNRFSTKATTHESLIECELQYNRREDIIRRHRESIAMKLGAVAAYAWTPSASNQYNKFVNLGETDSVIDAIIDLEKEYNDWDIVGERNLCLNATMLGRIKKENKNLYKDLDANAGMVYQGFRIWTYSKTPYYTVAGDVYTKKPMGSTISEGDKRSSFAWVTDEVFRCFGDMEMYYNLRDAKLQGDIISFAVRGAAGCIRNENPKYLGVIL